VRIGKEIGRRRLSARAPFEVEAQSIAVHAARTPFQRTHAAPFAEGAVVHVGTIGEIPDLFARPADERQAVHLVETPGQPPRLSDEPAELAGKAYQHRSPRGGAAQAPNGQELQDGSRAADRDSVANESTAWAIAPAAIGSSVTGAMTALK